MPSLAIKKQGAHVAIDSFILSSLPVDPTPTVRVCTVVKEAMGYFCGWAVSEHQDHGQDKLDTERVVNSVQEQVKKQALSAIRYLKHGDIGYIPFDIVNEGRRRNKNSGLGTFQRVLHHMSSYPWIGQCAVSAHVEAYKRSGFFVQAPITRYAGSRITSGNKTTTVDIASVPIEQLIAIDHRYCGMYRPTFINFWVRYHITTEKHCYGLAIADDREQVAAFACMRRCASGEYRIAPVYADTSDHAYELVAQLMSLVDKDEDDAQFVTDVHLANPAAKDMFTNKFGWNPLSTMMPMYIMWKKGPGCSTEAPKLDPTGCFAITAPELF